MTLEEFLKMDEENTLLPDQAQKVNRELSRATVNDIPETLRGRVLDYLLCVLNNDAVSPDLVSVLDELRIALENTKNI